MQTSVSLSVRASRLDSPDLKDRLSIFQLLGIRMYQFGQKYLFINLTVDDCFCVYNMRTGIVVSVAPCHLLNIGQSKRPKELIASSEGVIIGYDFISNTLSLIGMSTRVIFSMRLPDRPRHEDLIIRTLPKGRILLTMLCNQRDLYLIFTNLHTRKLLRQAKFKLPLETESNFEQAESLAKLCLVSMSDTEICFVATIVCNYFTSTSSLYCYHIRSNKLTKFETSSSLGPAIKVVPTSNWGHFFITYSVPLQRQEVQQVKLWKIDSVKSRAECLGICPDNMDESRLNRCAFYTVDDKRFAILECLSTEKARQCFFLSMFLCDPLPKLIAKNRISDDFEILRPFRLPVTDITPTLDESEAAANKTVIKAETEEEFWESATPMWSYCGASKLLYFFIAQSDKIYEFSFDEVA